MQINLSGTAPTWWAKIVGVRGAAGTELRVGAGRAAQRVRGRLRERKRAVAQQLPRSALLERGGFADLDPGILQAGKRPTKL